MKFWALAKPLGVNSGTMWTLALWVFPLLCKFSLAVLPAKPENISCIFYFDKSMNCTWSPEEEIGDTNYTVRLTYSFGKMSFIKQVTNASCSFSRSSIIYPDICTVEIEAQNRDGSTKSDITSWNLDHIREWLMASVSLHWIITLPLPSQNRLGVWGSNRYVLWA